MRDADTAPDLRTTDLPAEIRRCAGVLREVQGLDASALLSSQAPEPAADLVTVVVPMFRAARWIDDCLKGLLAQTHRNLEIFCVDDASDDATYDRVVDRFGADRRLCAIELAQNVGPFQISNWVGGRLARGRRIAWQDADNVSHPRRIADQGRWMNEEGYAISSTCVHHFFPPEIRPFRPQVPVIEADGMHHELIFYLSMTRWSLAEGLGGDAEERWQRAWRRNEVTERDLAARGLSSPAFVYRRKSSSHGCEMVDRELFRRFGGFSGRTKVSEDTDFVWRVTSVHDLGVLPRVLGSRRAHAGSLTRHPETAHRSSTRLTYEDHAKRRREEITLALSSGDMARASALSREELYTGEIEVRRAHLGFDVPLS